MSDKLETVAPQFPVISFENALEVARAVSEAGGTRTDVGRSVIASRLGSSQKSGSFIQRLASARSYGMIEGRGAFHLTENAKRYFFPTTDADRQVAEMAFLNTPAVFAQLIKRFDGNRMPSQDMLANVLHRDIGVADEWKGRVAALFVRASAAVGVIDSQGFLRFDANQRTADSARGNSSAEHPSWPGPSPDAGPARGRLIHHGLAPGVNTWVFSLGGETVRVETSDNLSWPLWQKLNSYVQVLKPSNKDSKK